MLNRDVIRHIGQISIGEILARMPILVAQILIAKSFGPLLFGIFSFIQLILNYSSLLEFGLLSGYSRNEPIALGSDNLHLAKKIRSCAFTGLFLISSLVFLCFVVISLLPVLHFHLSRIGVLLLGTLIIFQQMYGYFQSQYQNHKLFLDLSYGKCFYGISYLFFVYIFIKYKNINFIIIALSLSYVVVIFYFRVRKPKLAPKFLFRFDEFKSLFKVGLPIYLGLLGKFLLSSVDRIFIGVFLGAASLGYYSCSTVYVTVILTIYTIVPKVIYPHLLHQVDKRSKKELIDIFNASSCQMKKILDPIVCIICMMFYLVIRLFMPKYIHGLYPGLWLIFSAYMLGKSNMLCTILPVIDKSKEMLICTVISLLLMILSLLFAHFSSNAGILVYSIIVTINWFLFNCFLSLVVYLEYGIFFESLWNFFVKPTFIIFCFSCLLIFSMIRMPAIDSVFVFLISSFILLLLSVRYLYLSLSKNYNESHV